MKVSAFILMLSMLLLGTNPVIRHLQVSGEQTEACCDARADQDQEEETDHSCDAACDCGCQFHLNAVHFQFNNMQIAEEKEYYYGEYQNEYSFEYLSLLIHPPRLA